MYLCRNSKQKKLCQKKQKARNLPISECFITSDWEKYGECNILVVRKHANENYTLGIFLVDAFCLGVKNAGYRFNIFENEYAELKKGFNNNFEPTTYEKVHNIIYGALEYADELGFKPHKDFSVAKYILEEDTDEIPLIEYTFGHDGKPLLIVDTHAELNRYLPTLKKAVGDNFTFCVREDGDEDYEDKDEDEDEDEESELDKKIKEYYQSLPEDKKEKYLERMDAFLEKMEHNETLPHTPYNYQYPDYPQTLELTHKELEAIFDPKNNDKLEKETLDTILALPRKTLIKDLENCILYEIGQNCREISKKNEEEDIYGIFEHALNLLAEIEATESLPVVLELMRQSEDFGMFFFSYEVAEYILPALYVLAKNQLPVLVSYIKEPNLTTYFKSIAPSVFGMVLHFEPERRAEIIDIYNDILDFLYENIQDNNYYDANFAGMLINEPMDFCIVELLPKIKRLFDTGLVDEMACGGYNDVEKEINAGIESHNIPEIKSIYEIYK